MHGQDGGSNYYRGIAWYRKTLTVPGSFTGKSITLQFAGSSLVSDLYVDGTFIVEHRGAFGAWGVDLSNALAPGPQHLIAVKMDNSSSLSPTVAPQSADFNVNGGIYRKVTLLGTDKDHINTTDFGSSRVYFSSPTVSPASASVQVRTGLTNATATAQSLLVRSVLVDASGTIVSQMENTQPLGAGQTLSLTQSGTVANPHLWNGRPDPYLRDLYVEIHDATTNQLLDLVHQRVGIRSYAISPTQGILLNGVPYDLHGVNMHQDRLNEAWAISDADKIQDINLVLEIGATMLRTAHYEQNQLTYDLCDQYGLVVWAEIPNVNSSSTGAYTTNIQDQLRELIRQNYNHPSIIVWSVYNEVSDNATNDNVVTTLNNLALHVDERIVLAIGIDIAARRTLAPQIRSPYCFTSLGRYRSVAPATSIISRTPVRLSSREAPRPADDLPARARAPGFGYGKTTFGSPVAPGGVLGVVIDSALAALLGVHVVSPGRFTSRPRCWAAATSAPGGGPFLTTSRRRSIACLPSGV